MQFTLPVLSSILLILSYPKFDQGWLAWFALAPLALAIWRVKTLKQAALAGLAAGFFFYAGILYWIYPTMRAGGVGAPVSAFGLAALSLVMSAEFVVASVFGFYLKRAGAGIWPYIFALGWALLEYGKVLLSLKAVWFPWFMLGYTQWEYLPLIQIASLTGVYGLSAAVCFTGALAGTLLLPGGGRLKKALRFTPALIVFALLWGYGRYELEAASARTPAGYIDAALLQPCISLYDKWDAGKARGIQDKIEAMLSGLHSPDLIVWPENALPGWIDDPVYSGWLKRLSAKNKSWNLVGSVSHGDGRYVSAFLLNEEGEITASYDKRRLVPFGEYVPARGFLGKFVQPVASLGEFSEGALEQKLFVLKGRRLGGAICYESVFPYLFTADVKAGADVFFNITNDGWYLDTAAPYQHFLVNIFRAVETRRAVMRAANNGISAVIDPWGRVLAKKNLDEAGSLMVRVPVYADAGLTFYSSSGRWFVYVCSLAVAAFLFAVVFV
jgi:apolipoprotein N-acyltransferase